MSERDINVLLFNSIRTTQQRCLACGRTKPLVKLKTCGTCHNMYCDFCMNNDTMCFDCAHPVASLTHDPAFQAVLLEQQRIILENEPPEPVEPTDIVACRTCTVEYQAQDQYECRHCEGFYCDNCIGDKGYCKRCIELGLARDTRHGG